MRALSLLLLCAHCGWAQIGTSHVFDGSVADDQHGHSVCGVGDVDGDGHDDIAVGSYLADTMVGTNSGNVTVYRGVDGTVFWSVDGDAAGDGFGHALAAVGDLDGDAIPDIIAGAPFHDSNGGNAGRVKVISGADGSDLLVIDGINPNENLGFSVVAPGDVDQDGTPDLFVGARFGPNTAGNAYAGLARVYSGATGSVVHTFEGDSVGDQLGHAVGAAGDVDGDGIPDLVTSAYRDDDNGTDSGSVRVHAGVDGSLIHTLLGDDANDWFGWCVAGIGDVDGDGRDDFVVGAPYDDDGGPDSGSVRIYSGFDASELQRLDGSQDGDQLGYGAAALGDIDGDGVMDLGAGARHGTTTLGMTGYVVLMSAATGATLATVPGDAPGDWFGAAIANAGDTDLDGFDDFVIGAPYFDPTPTTPGAGRARVYVQAPVIQALSVTAPATVTLGTSWSYTLQAGAMVPAGAPYIMEVSLSGNSPGTPLPAPLIGIFPLNPPYLFNTWGPSSPSVFTNFAGHLDAAGQATATIDPPPTATLVGQTVWGAAVSLDPQGPMGIGFVSNGVTTVINVATPSLTAVSPPTGLVAGGTFVTVSGAGFLPGATVDFMGMPATSVTVVDGTTLTCITPSGPAGPADVTMTNPGGGTGTLTAGFTWTATTLEPSISLVSPNVGPVSGGGTVTLTGGSFSFGTTATVSGVSVPVTVIDTKHLSFPLPAGALGIASIVVVDPAAGASAEAEFTYVPDLLLAAVQPPAAPAGAQVLVRGDGFTPGVTLSVGTQAVPVTVINQLVVSFVVPSGAGCAGTLTISNPSGQTGSLTFNEVPTVTQVVNPSGPATGGGTFVVLGSGLQTATVTVGTTAATIVAQDATSIIAVAPPGPVGTATVTVTSPSACTATGTYTYN